MLLSWSEARDLAQQGFILGSHTFSHTRLSRLDDYGAFEEIRSSKAMLEDQLAMQVSFFSYPYSNSEARIERLVESAGYTAACAGDSGPWSLFHLWRVPCVRDDTTLSFALKARGWYDKRTALRESVPGQFLRSGVRMFRHRLAIDHPRHPDVLNHDPDVRPEREP